MKRFATIFALIALAGASSAPQVTNSPVVVVVAPGISYARVQEYLARGILPRDGGFAGVMQQGLLGPLLPVHSPETGPSRASLWTGAQPSVHGIVGNSFRKPGEKLGEGSGDFDEPLLAETVIDAARRSGKRVIRLVDWPLSELGTEVGFDFLPKAVSRSVILEFQVPSALPNRPSKKFHAMQAVSGPLEIPLSNNPGRVLLELERSSAESSYRARLILDGSSGAWVEFRRGSWACLRLGGNRASWVKIIARPGRFEAGAKGQIYVGPIVEASHHQAIAKFERQYGLWPGRPEGGMFRAGRVDEATWWEQAERLHQFHLQLGMFVLGEQRADLFLMDMSWLDSAGHIFMVEHPRQAAYSAENGAKRKRFHAYMEKSYRLLDDAIVALRRAAPRGAQFVVVSDHGMMAAHTAIPLQKLFGGLGWEVRPEKNPDVATYASFNSAHIHVAAGRVAEIARLVEFCKALTDPRTGEPVMQEVLTGSEFTEAGFGGSRAGDVWVVARPGYEISSEHDAEWQNSSMAGMHGYRGDQKMNLGLIAIAGAGVSSRPLEGARAIDFAATVSAMLGIRPPAQSSGKALVVPARGAATY